MCQRLHLIGLSIRETCTVSFPCACLCCIDVRYCVISCMKWMRVWDWSVKYACMCMNVWGSNEWNDSSWVHANVAISFLYRYFLVHTTTLGHKTLLGSCADYTSTPCTSSHSCRGYILQRIRGLRALRSSVNLRNMIDDVTWREVQLGSYLAYKWPWTWWYGAMCYVPLVILFLFLTHLFLFAVRKLTLTTSQPKGQPYLSFQSQLSQPWRYWSRH